MENNKIEDNKTEDNPLSLVERAEAAAARIEKAEAEIKATEQRMQEERTKVLLGGSTEAGQHPPQKTKEQEIKEGAVDFFKGSEIAEAIKKHG